MMKDIEEEINKLSENCLESYERWNFLYRNGGQDPFWADGTNLNLVRNHIIYYKGQIQEYCETEGIFKPDVFYRVLPPIVADSYMAKPEQIRQEAVSVFSRLIESDEYKKLNSSGDHITEISVSASNYLSFVKRLRTAIENDDLLTMRRYSFEF